MNTSNQESLRILEGYILYLYVAQVRLAYSKICKVLPSSVSDVLNRGPILNYARSVYPHSKSFYLLSKYARVS